MNRLSIDDQLRAECLELTAEMMNHLKLLRDYATTPGNAWLAKGELAKMGTITSDLDMLIERIKQVDEADPTPSSC